MCLNLPAICFAASPGMLKAQRKATQGVRGVWDGFCWQGGTVGGKRGRAHHMQLRWENQGTEETGNVRRIYKYACYR